MPAPTRRPRTWSTVVALAAVVLATAVCTAYPSVRPAASNTRTVVVDTGSGHADATLTPELRHPAASPHALQHPDVAALTSPTSRRPSSRPAPPASYRLTPPSPVSDAAPRGRAPPAA